MPKTDKRVDAYIKAAAPFAQPLLQYIRQTVHHASPEISETIKWGFPHFEYKGIVCSMAAFKAHCSLGFFRAAMMKNFSSMVAIGDTGMGHFGKITSLSDLPDESTLIAMIHEAMMINESGIKQIPSRKNTTKEKQLHIPEALQEALNLKKNAKAKKTFDAFSYSHKKEYCDWILEAKKEETKVKRIAATIEMLSEGKSRNWKYEKK